MQGLQGFYPTTEALKRERTQLGMPRGLDFIPLEIFLDVKSEATDYDRVLQKSDIMVSIDKFNNIRMPRGLEWPDTLDEYGEPIKHLRVHQVSVLTCRNKQGFIDHIYDMLGLYCYNCSHAYRDRQFPQF